VRRSEARYIETELLPLLPEGGGRCVMVGSSSIESIRQRPHLARLLAAIEHAGFAITNVDLKDSPNVDIVGDIGEPEVQQQIRALHPTVVMAANLLEHVTDPTALAGRIEELVDPGGYVLCTVPRSYPYHPDPLDNLYRPSPEDLTALFASCTLLAGRVVEAGRFLDLREPPGSTGRRLKSYVRCVVLGERSRRGVRHAARHRWWIRRPYTVSCCLLRRVPEPTSPAT
jgi:hypothetical protein